MRVKNAVLCHFSLGLKTFIRKSYGKLPLALPFAMTKMPQVWDSAKLFIIGTYQLILILLGNNDNNSQHLHCAYYVQATFFLFSFWIVSMFLLFKYQNDIKRQWWIILLLTLSQFTLSLLIFKWTFLFFLKNLFNISLYK